MDYSKKLTTGGKYATMFTMGDGNSGFVSFISIYNSTGGRLLSEDLTKLQVDTEEGLAAMNAINRFAKNKDLGMAWLEHIATPEVQKQVAIKWGRPPALQAMFEDPEVTKASPQFATVKEQSTYPSPRYGSPFYTDLGNVFVQNMLDMINGKGSPKETLTKIQTDGQKLIDDYWAKAK
jgi:ABC-type glycerol-3-phosphate transport system substrate-binding protein